MSKIKPYSEVEMWSIDLELAFQTAAASMNDQIALLNTKTLRSAKHGIGNKVIDLKGRAYRSDYYRQVGRAFRRPAINHRDVINKELEQQ